MRHALRLLARQPGFSVVAILTIAIAIGANTALFSVMNAVVLRPLDFPQPESLVRFWARNAERNLDAPAIFWDQWKHLRDHQSVFSQVAISVFGFATVTDGAEPEQVPTLYASVDFLPMLGMTPALGRNFNLAEDQSGAPPVAVISHRIWQTKFNQDPQVLGRAVTLDGIPTTIIGVLPPAQPVPFNTADIIQPRPYEVPFLPARSRDRAAVWQVTARLKPGVSRETAEAQLLQLHASFKQANPSHPEANRTPRLRFLSEEIHGNLDTTFWVLAGAVAAVLLIACANIANLALARLSARQKEIAIRASLGASRGVIVRQFLLESLIVAALGGLLGVLIASWSIEGIRLLAGQQLPRAADISLDATVLAFALAVTGLTALLVGLYPAIQASRTDVQLALKDSGRGHTATTGKTFRSALIVSEVSLSLILLVCAGLLISSFVKLQRTDLGFRSTGVAGGNVNLPASKYSRPELSREFFRQLQEKIAAAPELAGGGATTVMPLTQSASFSPFAVHGRPLPPLNDRPIAGIRTITTGYLAAMGIPLAAGRDFNDDDHPLPPGPNGAVSPATGVCLINEQLAQKLFPGESAVGQRLVFGLNDESRWEVVGVVKNVRTAGPAQPTPDEIYFPRSQRAAGFMTVVAKARPGLAADAVLPVLRRIVREIDPTLALASATTADHLVDQALAVPRLMMTLLMVFAGIAALLAAVGIYSVMAYSVARRTSEIGVRMALGATSGNILGLVLRGASVLLAGGLLLGLGGALAASRLLQQALYEVKPFDPLVFGAVSALFAFVAALACIIPAASAMRVDPLTALRAE